MTREGRGGGHFSFESAARRHGVEIQALPNFPSLPTVEEDGETFEQKIERLKQVVVAAKARAEGG